MPVRLGPRVLVAAARRNGLLGIETNLFVDEGKVRDGEDAIASTRAACAPQNFAVALKVIPRSRRSRASN
jgi:hypothetical protein